ncbi:unnamed protein product [Effrenium voratum]|nr:unnamed protein product [Effrenium voratum]
MAKLSTDKHHHHHHHHHKDRSSFKDGQKHTTPPVSDPTRVFYESLLEEKPDSPIAIRYCVEHGTLSAELHGEMLKKYFQLLRKVGSSSVAGQVHRQLGRMVSGLRHVSAHRLQRVLAESTEKVLGTSLERADSRSNQVCAKRLCNLASNVRARSKCAGLSGLAFYLCDVPACCIVFCNKLNL